MSSETVTDAARNRAATEPEIAPGEVVPVKRVLDAVRQDARTDAREYLDETEAKYGGE